MKVEFSTSATFDDAEHMLIERLRADPNSSPSQVGGNGYPVLDSFISSPRKAEHSGVDDLQWSHNAPLIDLIRGSSLLVDEYDISKGLLGSIRDTNHDHLEFHKKRIAEMLPNSADLLQILQCTQRFWVLWPLHPAQLTSSKELGISVVTVAKSFVEEAIASNNPGFIAKAIMWLALCIQQLPKDYREQNRSFPFPAKKLVSAYMDESDALLDLDMRSGPSCAGVECLVLQAKCCVNMGRPRQAWSAIRRALHTAILLGLHRAADVTETKDIDIWETVWRYDMQLSLILGFPHAASGQRLVTTKSSGGSSVEAKLMHRISVICGQINARNQDYNDATYSVTIRLDDEVEDIRLAFPPQWWLPSTSDSLPLGLFVVRQTLKLYFHQLKQLIHLPWVTKAITDKKYSYSRSSVLEAAESLISCYRDMKRHPDGLSVMCFLLDFHAFSSGMVLATDLISQQATWSVAMEEQKWAIVLGLIAELRQVSRTVECVVADQGAQVLQYLYDARHGIYSGPDIYEAIVPCFGKVRIQGPSQQLAQAQARTTMGLNYSSPHNQGTVELSSNMFNLDPSLNNTSGELDADWTSFLDDSIVYDWKTVFSFNAGSSVGTTIE
ncbi:hypothetical protein JX265_011568 [Neoarthrinium moseri]|uniref:Transcription factor domain-containing protein n=1 Tax=Neoarthrinium moseri TaxID=1658444 RepID=A0A9P9WCF0_9PEZI|nr:hypothetical protein JX266_005437 [Neoarthrinium moseri]KAI1856609.1 hypothetical protein JX265_011568 [Neoarthrinium moseri]